MDGETLHSLISDVRRGDARARDRLFEVLYRELERKAHHELARSGRDTLDTTGLVHEAYVRLARVERLAPNDKGHFMRMAARAMRSVLVDRARRRLSAKRGGGARHVTLDAAHARARDRPSAELVALDDALSRLEERDERLSQVVHLRYFAGLSTGEVAETLGVSERTVKRDWRSARAILHTMLSEGESGE